MIGAFLLFVALVFLLVRFFLSLRVGIIDISRQGISFYCKLALVFLSVLTFILKFLLPTFLFLAVFILLALPASIFFFKSSGKDSSVRMEINLLMLLSIFVSISMIEASFKAEDSVGEIVTDELFYSRISGESLSEHLSKVSPNAKILIIAYPKQIQPPTTTAAIQGFIDAAGKNLDIRAIDFPGNNPEIGMGTNGAGKEIKISPERMINIEKNLTAETFDELIMRYPDCDTLVFCISLPQNPEDMQTLVMPSGEPRKIAILKGSLKGLGEAIKAGLIIAAIATKPDFFKDRDISEAPKRKVDKQSAFQERFLLITPENVTEIQSIYPEIF